MIEYSAGSLLPGPCAAAASAEAEVYAALKMGVADCLGKNGFRGHHRPFGASTLPQPLPWRWMLSARTKCVP